MIIIFSLVLMIMMSAACVSAADNSTASSDDSSAADSADGEGSTGDEEIDLDVTYDEDTSETSDESDDSQVSVSLTKHATGVPLLALLFASLFPILRRK